MRLTPEQAQESARQSHERVEAYIARRRPFWPDMPEYVPDKHSEDL